MPQLKTKLPASLQPRVVIRKLLLVWHNMGPLDPNYYGDDPDPMNPWDPTNEPAMEEAWRRTNERINFRTIRSLAVIAIFITCFLFTWWLIGR